MFIIKQSLRINIVLISNTKIKNWWSIFSYFFLSLPYFGQFSEKLRFELVVLFGRHFCDVRCNVMLVNKFTVGSVFNCKDKPPMHLKSSLVYKFSCAQCASEYNGMTARTLGTRVDELLGVSCQTGASLTQPRHWAIRDHRDSCGTQFDTSNLLANASCSSDLNFLESLYIYKTKPILNNIYQLPILIYLLPIYFILPIYFLMAFFSFFCVHCLIYCLAFTHLICLLSFRYNMRFIDDDGF